MKRNKIRIDVDVSEFLDLLDAHEGPGAATVEALDEVLMALAEEIDLRVPVDTGSLRASQKIGNEVRRALGEWEGSVTYGGSSTGVKGYVVYARQAIHHSGAFDNLEAYAEYFEEAMAASVNAWRFQP